MHRRLPVYLLLDCSESMAGPSFEALQKGLDQMVGEMRRDPMALETAALSIITFASRAKHVLPLTDLIRFQPLRLEMGSGTALGGALALLEQAMNNEVRRTTRDQKGDYKPLVFVLTDGTPTDEWQSAAQRIKSEMAKKRANIIGVACGSDADLDTLRAITDTVLQFKGDEKTSFAQFFQWVSASVSSASVGFETGGPVETPNLPAGTLEMARGGGGPKEDRYAFLHMRCSTNKGFYIARLEKQKVRGGRNRVAYQPVANHPVDQFDFASETATAAGTIDTGMVMDVLPCPRCSNPAMAGCQCGHVFCSPIIQGRTMDLTCPWCGKTNTFAPGAFTTGGSLG